MTKVIWRKGFNPEIVATEIEKTVDRSAAGKIAFKGWNIVDHRVLLKSMVEFPAEISQHEMGGLVRSAIKGAAVAGKVTGTSLLAELRKATTSHLRKKETLYVLVSSFSLRSGELDRKLTIGSATIRISAALKKSVAFARSQLLDKAQFSLNGPNPKDYSFISASIHARSLEDAFERGMRAINLIRAIWNFYKNRQISRLIFGTGKWQAINKLVSGPFHTIHLPNGALASDQWFYEPNFHGATKVATLSDFKNFRKFETNVRRKLGKLHYRTYVEDALIRYSAALDNADWNACFLELWGVLELLTDTKNANYAQTIERASSIYKSSAYEVQVLNHLRIARNNYAHQSESNSDIITLIYQLKQTVEYLIEFHLGHERGFKSSAEAMHFLELPRDHNSIAREIRLLKMADKYRR